MLKLQNAVRRNFAHLSPKFCGLPEQKKASRLSRDAGPAGLLKRSGQRGSSYIPSVRNSYRRRKPALHLPISLFYACLVAGLSPSFLGGGGGGTCRGAGLEGLAAGTGRAPPGCPGCVTGLFTGCTAGRLTGC